MGRQPILRQRRTRQRAALCAVAGLLMLPGCTPAPAGQVPAQQAAPATTAAARPSAAAVPSAAAPAVPVRRARIPKTPRPQPAPRFLSVEGTSIAVDVVPVAVDSSQAMQIPDSFGQAGWYRYSAAPGAGHGTAVIAAHVDTLTDLAPFSQLQHLARGTQVTVARRGAPPVTYRVSRVDFVGKDKFDGDALFPRGGPHLLKLVTCGGRWLDDRHDYSDNVVVTAVPE
jgi:hypothetical protein